MTRAAKLEKATKSRSDISADDRLSEVERKVGTIIRFQKRESCGGDVTGTAIPDEMNASKRMKGLQ